MSDVIHTISEIQIDFKNGEKIEFAKITKNDEVLTKALAFCK